MEEEKDALEQKAKDRAKAVQDSLAAVAEQKAKEELEKQSEKVAEEIKDKVGEEVGKKVEDVLGEKGKAEIDNIKNKLDDWNPFGKKKKKKEGN